MKEHAPLTKKQHTTITVIGIALLLLGFCLLIVASVLQSRGANSVIFIVLGLLAFAVWVADVIFMFSQFGRLFEYEYDQKRARVESSSVSEIHGVSEQGIKEACLREKLEEKDGLYFHKREFSFKRDAINYYVRAIDSDNVESTLNSEFGLFDRMAYKTKNKCLVLIMFKSGVTEKDIKLSADASKSFIFAEITAHSSYFNTAVTVIVDTNTGVATFVPCKSKHTVYDQGVKLLEKLCN